MAGTETPHHHGDHRHLVWKADDSSPQAKVDAIIVPTARPVAYLKDAAAAALSLDCPLITLHSQKWTSVHEAFQYLGQSIDLIAIDMPEAGELRLPPLETTAARRHDFRAANGRQHQAEPGAGALSRAWLETGRLPRRRHPGA